MITERFNKIKEITQSKPTRLREVYFINNFPDIHSQINLFCYNISELKFVQKIWHWVNNKENYFLCKCGKPTTFHKNWTEGYRIYCSAKCAQTQEETKEKRKKTTLEKWGTDNVAKSDKVKEKQEETNMKRWGFKSTSQNELVKEKYKNTILKKWGKSHYFQTEDFKLKTKQYYLKKWGVEHPLDVEEIKQKIKNTCLDRYGVETYLNTEHARNNIVKYNKSKYELDLAEWLRSYADKIELNSKIINPLTLDIYLPDFNVAIEFNGLYWHSEIFKEKDYHLKKTLMCQEKGIHLIHIWEDDWLNRNEIIKSIITNKMNKIERKIWARKCKIRELNNNDTADFLNNNHIQGYSRFSKSLALIYEDQIVSVMTFGMRAINGKKQYELLRFANKIFTNVVGAASKLFKHFSKTENLNEIISYADISMFSGKLYEKLGFEFKHKSSINYWWVVRGIRQHRFTYNKKKLVKRGYDPLMTEVEIMHSLGHYRIWGCGQDKWIWKN